MQIPFTLNSGRLWAPEFPFAPGRWPFFYGWTITAVGTLAVIASIPGQTMGVGVFTDHLMEALGLTRTQLSLAYLIGTMLSGFLLPAGGRFYDRCGARRMVVISTVLLGCSLLFLSLAEVLSHGLRVLLPSATASFLIITIGFFALRFTGQGLLTMAGRNVIAQWFDRQRGLAVGLSGVLTSFAFSVAPQGLDSLISAFGMSGTWLLLGSLMLLPVSFIGWFLLRDNPEQCGLTMDGKHSQNIPPDTNLDSLLKRSLTRREALRTPSFWIFNLSFGFQAFAITAYTFHVVDIARMAGVSRNTLLSVFFYASFFSVAANLITGWLSARTRVKYLLAVENATALLFWLALLFVPLTNSPGLILLTAGLGISGGIWGNLMGVVFARFFGRDFLGAISGVVMSTMVISSALGPYAFGLAKELFGSYDSAALVSALCVTLLFIASFFADNPQRRVA